MNINPFVFVDTHGIPLSIMVQLIQDKGDQVDYLGFYLSAIKAGWNPKTAAARIREAQIDNN